MRLGVDAERTPGAVQCGDGAVEIVGTVGRQRCTRLLPGNGNFCEISIKVAWKHRIADDRQKRLETKPIFTPRAAGDAIRCIGNHLLLASL